MVKKTFYSLAKSLKEKASRRPKEVSREFSIDNELGFHARAAAQFVKIASRYHCEVLIRKDSRTVNGKSIMGILMLAASKGSQVTVVTQGSDAKEAMEELAKLIEDKFGEKS